MTSPLRQFAIDLSAADLEQSGLVRVQRYVRRRRPKSIVDFAGHRIRVGKEGWPSEEGLSKMRRHFKRAHPRRFRQMIEKGVRTRRMRRAEMMS